MSLEDLESFILDLLKARDLIRVFDDRVAEQFGWQRVFKDEIDQKTGKTIKTQSGRWYPPGSTVLTRVPNFTRDIQAAYDLASSVSNGARIGFAWEQGRASAVIGDARIVEARTPAVAICVAALIELRRNKNLGSEKL